MRLEALDSGSGPAVLLLHGQPGRAAHWSSVIELLRHDARVIAPDRPGYGDSDARAGGFFFNAAAAVELLDRAGVESAVVAGHSWGGGAALALASRFPQRVRALVLVGTVVPRAKPDPIDRAFANRFFGPPATRLGIRAGGLALSWPPARRLAGYAAPAFSPEALRRTAAEWRGDRVWRAVYAEQRALVEELPVLAAELASIAAPATLLSGRHDLVSPPGRLRELARALPASKLVRLDRGGHLLPQQRPRLVAAAIAAAVSSSAGRA